MTIRDLDWLDAGLHTLLGLVVGAAFGWAVGDWQVGAHFGALAVFMREFAQAEMDEAGKVSFVRGLRVWTWGTQKHMETWLPVVAIEVAGVVAFMGLG